MSRKTLRSALLLSCVVWAARAIGCDPSSTNGAVVDTDGDGLTDVEERMLHGTSPLLADTDGDGLTDYEELIHHGFDPEVSSVRFNPLVADLPVLEVDILAPPLLSFVITDGTGETRTFGTTQIWEESFLTSESATASVAEIAGISEAATVGEQAAVTREIAVSKETGDGVVVTPIPAPPDVPSAGMPTDDPDDGPIVVTLALAETDTANVSFTTTGSRSTEVVLSFTQEVARQFLQALELAESYSASRDIVASEGILQVLAVLRNRGNIPFQVSNLTLSSFLVLGDGVLLPVGNLDLLTRLTHFQPFAMAPGQEVGPINFYRPELTLEQMSQVIGNLSALVVRVGLTELNDATGKSYVFDVPSVRGRTATVDVDYGEDGKRERHLVATNHDPGKPGVGARHVFDHILRIPLECDDEDGLVSVRAVPGGGDAASWCAYHRRSGGAEETPYCPYDCSDIELRAGDLLRLTRPDP